MDPKKLLWTTDLSEESMRPTDWVRTLAGTLGLEVTLLHVVEVIAVAPPGGPMAPPVRPADIPAEMEHARKALHEKAAALEGMQPSIDVISAQDVARAICDYAEEKGMDMIALSTHGRSGFRRLVLGSVAEHVLRHAAVPVLVIPRKE